MIVFNFELFSVYFQINYFFKIMLLKTPKRNTSLVPKKLKRDYLGKSMVDSLFGSDQFHIKKNNGCNGSNFKSVSKKQELSFSFKKQQRTQSRSKSKTHSTKATKQDRRNIACEISQFDCYQQPTKKQRKLEEEMRKQLTKERRQNLKRKQQSNDQLERSLQFFEATQKNLLKRKQLLKQYKHQLNQSWKQMIQLLSTSSNSNRKIVEQAVSMLVSQRLIIEEESEALQALLL